jgi:hypothetical protein
LLRFSNFHDFVTVSPELKWMKAEAPKGRKIKATDERQQSFGKPPKASEV